VKSDDDSGVIDDNGKGNDNTIEFLMNLCTSVNERRL